MHSQCVLSPIEKFILDCADLACALDNLDLHQENPETLMAAAILARGQFEALLLQRRSGLSPTVVEAGWVDFMLDNVRSRLDFVDSRLQQSQPRITTLEPSLSRSLP